MYLEKINNPSDVKKLNLNELNKLADEIRQVLLKKLSKHGGHFGPNLGMVEATIALHYVFNSPQDKLIFDVSHQSYPHKILTGRKDAFLYEDKYDDVTGYSCPDESEHDFFEIGHTSTSISLAGGMAKARDLLHNKENIVAIIGDGSLSGGEALEGLDFAGEMNTNFIIVVNDNDMSIAENHGGIYKNLKLLRETEGKAELNIFKAMGLDYTFVKDGNNIDMLIAAFDKVKDTSKPVVVHIVTQKGKGYPLAEKNRESWHWCMPFDLETGKPKYTFNKESYADITAQYLLKKMQKDSSVCAITSGTPTVFGFYKENREKAGPQFIDVGIAEEHAVALASGIAKNGGKPVYGVYSTFLQRAYDQLSQDVCLNSSPVTFLVFSASIWGMNAATHLGIYDIPMISNIPKLVYLAPTCKEEYMAMLEWSVEQNEYPVAIRVPSNDVISYNKNVITDYSQLNKYQITRNGSKVAVIPLGDFYQLGEKIAEKLDATLINPIYITGIDQQLLCDLEKEHTVIVTIEDGIINGGFGEKISAHYSKSKIKVLNYGFKKEFLNVDNPNEIMKENGITVENIVARVKELL